VPSGARIVAWVGGAALAIAGAITAVAVLGGPDDDGGNGDAAGAGGLGSAARAGDARDGTAGGAVRGSAGAAGAADARPGGPGGPGGEDAPGQGEQDEPGEPRPGIAITELSDPADPSSATPTGPAADAAAAAEAATLVASARGLATAGRYGEALALFRRAHALDPRAATLFDLGVMEHRTGRCREARRTIQRVIAAAPGGALTRKARALLDEIGRCD
jgi:hypothetical protein